MYGGGGVFSVLLFAVAAFALVQVLSNNVGLDEGGGYGSDRMAVARVQVGLLGSARQLQQDLERIAKRADTNDVEGLQYILQGECILVQHSFFLLGQGVSRAEVSQPEELIAYRRS